MSLPELVRTLSGAGDSRCQQLMKFIGKVGSDEVRAHPNLSAGSDLEADVIRRINPKRPAGTSESAAFRTERIAAHFAIGVLDAGFLVSCDPIVDCAVMID